MPRHVPQKGWKLAGKRNCSNMHEQQDDEWSCRLKQSIVHITVRQNCQGDDKVRNLQDTQQPWNTEKKNTKGALAKSVVSYPHLNGLSHAVTAAP